MPRFYKKLKAQMFTKRCDFAAFANSLCGLCVKWMFLEALSFAERFL